MPAAKDKRKIYKCVRKTVDDNKDCLVIKFKNLRPIDVRELRGEINLLTKDFFVQEEPIEAQTEYYDDKQPQRQRQVHFPDEPKKRCLVRKHGSQTR